MNSTQWNKKHTEALKSNELLLIFLSNVSNSTSLNQNWNFGKSAGDINIESSNREDMLVNKTIDNKY